jgi:hypothetical protein
MRSVGVIELGIIVQEYIREHAQKVGRAGLGSPYAVQAHIEEAIMQVWKNLPPEHPT